jgi:hypothetical protein
MLRDVHAVHVFVPLQVTEMFEQLSTIVVDSTQASVSDLAGKQQQVCRCVGNAAAVTAGSTTAASG